MENLLPLYQFLSRFVDLSDDDFYDNIAPYVTIRKFGKKAQVTRAGDVEDHFNFILSGLVRKFYRNGSEEINTQISMEDHIIHVQESFHGRMPSEFYIETIEPTTLASITYDDLERIYASSPKMERLGRLVITFSMTLRDKWQVQLVKHSPRERFVCFVHSNPEMLQRVPQKYLASFLNIQPETFSRFKHLIRERREA